MGIEVERRQTIDYDVMRQMDRAEYVEFVYVARPLSNGLGLEFQREIQELVLQVVETSGQTKEGFQSNANSERRGK